MLHWQHAFALSCLVIAYNQDKHYYYYADALQPTSSLHTLPAGFLSKKQQINPGTQQAPPGFAASPEPGPDVAGPQLPMCLHCCMCCPSHCPGRALGTGWPTLGLPSTI
jgi:hypothetical protein